MGEKRRSCPRATWDKGAERIHKGHFHIPAGMVVRRGQYTNRRYICHRGAFFLRQKDFDILGIKYPREGDCHGRWGGMVRAQERLRFGV